MIQAAPVSAVTYIAPALIGAAGALIIAFLTNLSTTSRELKSRQHAAALQ